MRRVIIKVLIFILALILLGVTYFHFHPKIMAQLHAPQVYKGWSYFEDGSYLELADGDVFSSFLQQHPLPDNYTPVDFQVYDLSAYNNSVLSADRKPNCFLLDFSCSAETFSHIRDSAKNNSVGRLRRGKFYYYYYSFEKPNYEHEAVFTILFCDETFTVRYFMNSNHSGSSDPVFFPHEYLMVP